jgi:catechol 2,3-dioxygenase-like lactoylglutathione lyase family enzyme
MAVRKIDHVNIRTPRVADTVRFYVDLLGMKAVPRPGTEDMASSAWLCDATGQAAIHVGSGRVHHAAFECSDYSAMRARLEAGNQIVGLSEVPQIALRQIFVRDPNGILVELNFR